MKTARRSASLIALSLCTSLGLPSLVERPDPFPAYYPSTDDRAAAEAALEAATEHLAAGELERATKEVRKATRLIPTSAVPHVLLGMIGEKQSRSAEAVGAYREALAWNPHESRALAALERLEAPRYGDIVTQYEDELFALINEAREAEGRPALKPHPALAEVARAYSRSMRDHGFFSHQSPRSGETTALDRFLKRFEGRPGKLGENISRRWTRPQPALNDVNIARSHAELMMSTSHRKNILHPDFVYVGVGIATNPMGDYWITEVFMTPRSQKDPIVIRRRRQ